MRPANPFIVRTLMLNMTCAVMTLADSVAGPLDTEGVAAAPADAAPEEASAAIGGRALDAMGR